MWWFAVPQRAGRTKTNRLVVCHRALLRGAPFVLLLCAVAPCAQAAPKAPFARLSSSCADVPIEVSSGTDSSELSPQRVRASSSLGASFAAGSPGSPDFSRVREQGWDVPVSVLSFQRLPRFTQVHSACVIDVTDLVEQTASACDALLHGQRFCEVVPQPCVDYFVLLSFPMEHDSLARIPVCVQMHGPRGHDMTEVPRFWCDFYESPLHYSDVAASLANEWLPGSRVFVGAEQKQLRQSGLTIVPGDLVYIVRPHATKFSSATVAAKLTLLGATSGSCPPCTIFLGARTESS